MIVLDTNVLSELMKAQCNARVQAWLSEQPPLTLFITAVTEAELRYGAAILPQGRRRKTITSAIDAMLTEDFDERILPFDSSASIAYATIAAERRHAGRPIAQFDAQIAAIAASPRSQRITFKILKVAALK
jgi:predicted nucleic acid-binding protein